MISHSELLFIAYQELVEVESNSYIPHLNLISDTYTSLSPLDKCRLPLYIALELKKSDLVQIRIPLHYTKQKLSKILEDEERNISEYSTIPEYMFLTGKLIIKNSYNVEDKEEIINYIDKIKDIRMKKTLHGLSKMEGRALNLNNLTKSEWYEIREMIVRGIEERKLMNSK